MSNVYRVFRADAEEFAQAIIDGDGGVVMSILFEGGNRTGDYPALLRAAAHIMEERQ